MMGNNNIPITLEEIFFGSVFIICLLLTMNAGISIFVGIIMAIIVGIINKKFIKRKKWKKKN